MKFNELLQESQFHGGRRLSERNCRWYFCTSMLVLFGSAVTVICVTIGRFFDNPTFVVRQESVETETEFPSVLVCPEIYYSDDKIDRFLSQMDIPPNLNITYLKEVIYMLGAFYAPDVIYKPRDLENVEHLLEFNNMDVDTAARLLTTSCKSTLIRCRWNSFIVNCSSLFHMELTGVGYCCVFNGKSLRDIHDVSHHNHINQRWYTNKYGFDSGLMLAINQSQLLHNVDLSYKWVVVQSGKHFVESSINGSALSPKTEHWLQYYSTNFQIGEDARELSSELRQCRLARESLKFFPIYKQKYCVVECELERTLNTCGCISLVHPRAKGTRYCKARQLECAHHALVAQDESDCDCPQACDVTIGLVRASSFELMSGIKPIDTFYDGLNYDKTTIVRVFVKNGLVLTNSRWSFFNKIDLFAQLGGVFNMFFGCSILTLLELAVLAYRGLASMTPSHAQTRAKFRGNQHGKGAGLVIIKRERKLKLV